MKLYQAQMQVGFVFVFFLVKTNKASFDLWARDS